MKLIAVNVAVLVALLVSLEPGIRVLSFARSCSAGTCDRSTLVAAGLPVSPMDAVAPHPRLGYAPVPTWDGTMWGGKKVAIRDGFRSNGDVERRAGAMSHPNYALAVGDSYTFGDEVSDHETWVSCVERSIGRSVKNAGVYGYGGAQAVLRAEVELQRSSYEVVIWSLLLLDDFPRDTRAMRFGARGPRVIQTDGRIEFEHPLAKFKAGNVDEFLLEHSKLWRYANRILAEYLVPDRNGDRRSGRRVTASIDQIIGFAVARFAALPVGKKVIVFQYNPYTLVDPRTRVEKEKVATLARAYGIPVIDTADEFTHGVTEDFWINGVSHHTPLGNRKVCEAILRAKAV